MRVQEQHYIASVSDTLQKETGKTLKKSIFVHRKPVTIVSARKLG